MSIRRTEFEGVEGICLENDSISLVVCPSVGGKIVSFALRTRARSFFGEMRTLPCVLIPREQRMIRIFMAA